MTPGARLILILFSIAILAAGAALIYAWSVGL